MSHKDVYSPFSISELRDQSDSFKTSMRRMSNKLRRHLLQAGAGIAGIFLISTVVPAPASALPVGVTYTATALGGGTWQYDYVLTGSFSAGEDLAVYFPLATSADLTDLMTGGPDWTTFVFQPDPAIPADGEFDMMANVNSPSLASSFDVTFLYSGSGAPGSQAFTLFDSTFDIVASGNTVPVGTGTSPVPEPLPLLLTGLGIISIFGIKGFQQLR